MHSERSCCSIMPMILHLVVGLIPIAFASGCVESFWVSTSPMAWRWRSGSSSREIFFPGVCFFGGVLGVGSFSGVPCRLATRSFGWGVVSDGAFV